MNSHVQIEVLRTPEEVSEALQLQRIAACPIRSRLLWTAGLLAAHIVSGAWSIVLPWRLVMALLPYAGLYAYSDSFAEWREGWALYVPPAETIDAAERKRFLDAIADILEKP